MAYGPTNAPGVDGAEMEQIRGNESALRTRVGNIEKTLSGREKIPGTTAPTAQVSAQVGQIYINTDTGEEWKCIAVNDSGTVWEKLEGSAVGLTAADVGAVSDSEKGMANGVATLDDGGKVPAEQLPSMCPFVVGTSAPEDKLKLWIDTTADTGGLKYFNGSTWVSVPVSYT